MYLRVFKTSSNILSMVFICLLILGCHFNSVYNNRETDKQDGEKAVVAFYELIKSRSYEETYMLFDKSFFEVTDTQKLNEIYDISFKKLGNVESYRIEKWETQAVVGTSPKTNYVFQLNVKRSHYLSQETVILLKEKDDIKIVSYHVNSDGFFKR